MIRIRTILTRGGIMLENIFGGVCAFVIYLRLQSRVNVLSALTKQMWRLPSSVQTEALALNFQGNSDHSVEPFSFLVGDEDILSTSLRLLSTNLTTLAVTVNHISPSLFWDAKIPFSDSQSILWPNLRILDVRTGFETADGK